MSDRIDHHDDSVGALFDSLVARESGTARNLVPRLPTMFEAAPVGDAPEPAAADEVVAPFPPAPPGHAAPPEADAGPWPDRSAPSRAGEEPVQDRQEVVRVERQVLVETGKASTPGDRDGDEVVAPFRPAPPGHAAPPVADAVPWPDRSAPSSAGEEPVRHRQEVVRVERQVLVEASKASTPGDRDGDDRGAPRPGPAAPDEDIPRAHERRPSPEDGTPPGPRRAVRPPDEGPALRPLTTELTEPAPEWPMSQADRHQGGLPVVVTRREVLVPRPEQARATPELPRPAEPIVRVSIGRLEIRAVPDPAPARTPRRERRTQSLEDYLERRNQGSRS